MKSSRAKAIAVGLALLCLLTAPGSEAFQAMAAVTVQSQAVAPLTAPAQVGAMGMLAPGTSGSLSTALSPVSLKGTLSVTPTPGVRTQAAPSPLALTAPAAVPSAAAKIVLAPQGTPVLEAPTALQALTQGSERIAASAGQGGSVASQRQAVDELFLGRGLAAPDEVAAAPLADSAPSGLRPAALAGSAAPRAPPAPQRSLLRSLRVGWLAAVAPLAITLVTTAVAAYLGYQQHPGYQSPVPHQLTVATVSALAVDAAVMAPVSEEMLFRNGLLAGLRRMMRRIPLLGEFWLPALVSSVVFVAVHELSDPLLFATRLVHSLILSYAYHKEGLPSSIAAHAFFNGLLTLPLVLSLLPGPAALIANILTLPIAALLTWRVFKALKAQAPDQASGRVQPLELTALPSLLLAALLVAGYVFLVPNPIWILGAFGYVWRAARLMLRKMRSGPRAP
ncbi:MAG: CPBP family intramembrane metalloprotease [Elusimicrobia bacterium]|nr:CPBP family intramembrane metalloprotease [Elusimicrobiota bacterium]